MRKKINYCTMVITVVLGVTAEYPAILKLHRYNNRHSLYIFQNGKPVPKFDFAALLNFAEFKKSVKTEFRGLISILTSAPTFSLKPNTTKKWGRIKRYN